MTLNGLGDPLTDRQEERGGSRRIFAVEVAYSAADMTKPAEIAAVVAEAEKRFGSADVLVNNAGIQHVSPIEEFPVDKWDAIIAINLCRRRSTPSAPPSPA